MTLKSIIGGALSCALLFSACKKDDPPLPDNLVQFETAAQGIADGVKELDVKVKLSRATSVAGTVELQLTEDGVVYGTDYTTEPAASSNKINVPVAAGATEAVVKIKIATAATLLGSESITFKINTVPADLVIGTTSEIKISFSTILSTGAKDFVMNGKTDASPYFNTVYVDLSNNQSTLAARNSWNLGFYSGTAYRVVLNSHYQTTVKALAKSDITTVGFADTVGVRLNHDPSDPTTVSLVDNWDGAITKTAIAEVSATDSENKVYLLSFENSKDQNKYYKIKVSRTATGYRLQYALVGETTINTLEIPKNSSYNHTFVSVENKKIVTVEPKKAEWDIKWGYDTYNSGLGSPYWFQDFISINNLAGVQAAEVMTSTVTYENYKESDIAGTTFLSTRDAIGNKWRVTSGVGLGVRGDRFYVVKDAGGNYYKLKFVSMGLAAGGGERGKPVIDYVLVKKA